jgi:hypothetical protein
MDRSEFERRLVLAARQAIEFAATMVRQKLPAFQQFLISPNQSYDGNPLEDDQELFPEDSLPPGKTHGPVGAAAAADWLWRQGKVPEWIDVRAFDADASSTTLWLTCCGRFTALTGRLYHTEAGNPPFHVTGPSLPTFEWKSVERDGRFDLEAKRRAG